MSHAVFTDRFACGLTPSGFLGRHLREVNVVRSHADGRPIFVPDLDEAGRPRVGTLTHSYSIASAPFESLERRYLEFHVARTLDDHGAPGRPSEMLFGLAAHEPRAAGARLS